MQIQHHIGKIFWTVADKAIYILYGLVYLIQASIMDPSELGLFALLIALNIWIFVITDSFALQLIIQFGFAEESRNKVNAYALILHIAIVMVLSSLIMLFSNNLSVIFDESRISEIGTLLPLLGLLMIPRTFAQKLMLRDHKMFLIFLTDIVFFGVISYFIFVAKFNNLSFDFYDAINAYMWGAASSSLIAILLVSKNVKIGLKGEITLIEMINFSIPITLTNLLNTIPKHLDLFIIKIFFDLHFVGLYQTAKTLFRFFEEGINGVNGLVYPAAVRFLKSKDYSSFKQLLHKALSFTLLTFSFLSLILASGILDGFIEWFLSSKYTVSLDLFKVMLIMAVMLPFTIFYFLVVATGKVQLLLTNTAISIGISILTYIIFGILEMRYFMPLGYAVYLLSMTILNYNLLKKETPISISPTDLFSAINDTINYLKKKSNSRL